MTKFNYIIYKSKRIGGKNGLVDVPSTTKSIYAENKDEAIIFIATKHKVPTEDVEILNFDEE